MLGLAERKFRCCVLARRADEGPVIPFTRLMLLARRASEELSAD
jgi:hypothetical protein